MNSYLKNLTPEARKGALDGVIRQDGAKTVINGPALATLIESAKAMALIGTQGWKDGGDPFVKKALDFYPEAGFRCGWRGVRKEAAGEVLTVY